MVFFVILLLTKLVSTVGNIKNRRAANARDTTREIPIITSLLFSLKVFLNQLSNFEGSSSSSSKKEAENSKLFIPIIKDSIKEIKPLIIGKEKILFFFEKLS
ncbi:hypothetical protein SDC9_180742 [bioreactor metagenome]|uniref:Uncharacterized protein n=1 Tax=bioreactor metagenome TaxID=1076179 RepID=A0A645H2L6_9ZZZZ